MNRFNYSLYVTLKNKLAKICDGFSRIESFKKKERAGRTRGAVLTTTPHVTYKSPSTSLEI